LGSKVLIRFLTVPLSFYAERVSTETLAYILKEHERMNGHMAYSQALHQASLKDLLCAFRSASDVITTDGLNEGR
jgi:hypothetical protein